VAEVAHSVHMLSITWLRDRYSNLDSRVAQCDICSCLQEWASLHVCTCWSLAPNRCLYVSLPIPQCSKQVRHRQCAVGSGPKLPASWEHWFCQCTGELDGSGQLHTEACTSL